jgi:hypothetical protein
MSCSFSRTFCELNLKEIAWKCKTKKPAKTAEWSDMSMFFTCATDNFSAYHNGEEGGNTSD